MRYPWQRRSGRRWSRHAWAVVAVVVALVAVSVTVLGLSQSRAGLVARGTPLPGPSSPATPPPATPQATAPVSTLREATTITLEGKNQVVVVTSTAAALNDQGRGWVQIPVPSGASGVIIDHADANVLAAGGSTVQTTSDGGRHWAATPRQPPGGGPFLPLLISPWDPSVLFVSHRDQLAVTLNDGTTWRDIEVPRVVHLPRQPAEPSPSPKLGAPPVMTSGSSAGTFFLSAQGRNFELTGNGGQVETKPQLPRGIIATALAVGQNLLVARCSNRRLLILRGNSWTEAPITSAGPFAIEGTDLWAVVPASGANGPEAVEESSDGGATWKARPGLPLGSKVIALTLSGDDKTTYALTSRGDVYEAKKDIWYQMSTGFRSATSPG